MSRFKHIAGVIWNDPVRLPSLDQSQLEQLVNFHVTWNPDDGFGLMRNSDGDLRNASIHHQASFDDIPEEISAYFEMAMRDIRIVNAFNPYAKRKQWFLNDDDLKETAHLHVTADNIWEHRHIGGKESGLNIYYPTDNKPLSLWAHFNKSSTIRVITIRDLVKSGAVASVKLQEHDVIVFNQNLLHESDKGPRLRSAVNGTKYTKSWIDSQPLSGLTPISAA